MVYRETFFDSDCFLLEDRVVGGGIRCGLDDMSGCVVAISVGSSA